MSVKTTLISGGARGIGRCRARRFLERGYKVYIFDIDEEELTHATRTHLKQYYEKGMLQSSICNLRDVQEIRDKVKVAAEFLGGRISVIVKNGGIASPRWSDGRSMDGFGTMDQWQVYMETNLTAPFAVSQACLPYMKPEEGKSALHIKDDNAGPCIIHIGSFRAHQSDPNQEGPYARHGHQPAEGDEKGTEWAALNEDKDVDDHPTNRAGRPKDIADAAEYLVNAGFVTGQDLTVDGGATKKKA
ncbi:NAD(P)-binding protein [Xylaria arbuscula]|nr:NAD(P)-binding protein [Xylaria arbuscula]